MMNNQTTAVADGLLDAMTETAGILSEGVRANHIVDHVFDLLDSPYAADSDDAAWAHELVLHLIWNQIGILDVAEAFVDAFTVDAS